MCVDKPNIQTCWSLARLAFLHKLQWVDSLRNFESEDNRFWFGKKMININWPGGTAENKERDKQFRPLKTGYFFVILSIFSNLL